MQEHLIRSKCRKFVFGKIADKAFCRLALPVIDGLVEKFTLLQ